MPSFITILLINEGHDNNARKLITALAERARVGPVSIEEIYDLVGGLDTQPRLPAAASVEELNVRVFAQIDPNWTSSPSPNSGSKKPIKVPKSVVPSR
ncbi:MAG: hypothetical protein IPK19_29180 [Chloroflexi bacterium]|nr:hypothetical protein [Chloroflexota bacterium]